MHRFILTDNVPTVCCVQLDAVDGYQPIEFVHVAQALFNACNSRRCEPLAPFSPNASVCDAPISRRQGSSSPDSPQAHFWLPRRALARARRRRVHLHAAECDSDCRSESARSQQRHRESRNDCVCKEEVIDAKYDSKEEAETRLDQRPSRRALDQDLLESRRSTGLQTTLLGKRARMAVSTSAGRSRLQEMAARESITPGVYYPSGSP